MSEAQAFEKAILEKPDEIASYAAYADWLQEHDDPRGEFMQVQLTLENPSLQKEGRKTLQARERELLDAHETQWLGELTPLLLQHSPHGKGANVGHWWVRGFLAELTVQHLTVSLADLLATAPAARFVRSLRIATAEAAQSSGIPGLTSPSAFAVLIGIPCLQNLRVLQVGDEPEQWADGRTEATYYTPGLEQFVANLPCIEELYLMCSGYDAATLFGLPNLTHLQTLRVYGLGNDEAEEDVVPLGSIARNLALGSLTHLIVHPCSTPNNSSLPHSQVHALMNSPHLTSLEHLQLRLSDMGDDGVRSIIESGKLKQLGWLDLRNGTITDSGAKALADYPPTRSLRRLDLSRNRVTHAGLNMLRRAEVNAVVENALSRREIEEREREEREAEME
ncbi:MAG: TIGR02996 domain-containing protein [Planctomycetes bacterium]|nr:TIGR02996 domain-containing protein [Planctomycetota bacterium]